MPAAGMSHRQGVSFFSITCKSCLDSEVLRSWPKSAGDACSVNLRRPIMQRCVQMQLVLVKASFLADQKHERSSCFKEKQREPLPCLLPRVIMGPQPALASCLLPSQTLQSPCGTIFFTFSSHQCCWETVAGQGFSPNY